MIMIQVRWPAHRAFLPLVCCAHLPLDSHNKADATRYPRRHAVGILSAQHIFHVHSPNDVARFAHKSILTLILTECSFLSWQPREDPIVHVQQTGIFACVNFWFTLSGYDRRKFIAQCGTASPASRAAGRQASRCRPACNALKAGSIFSSILSPSIDSCEGSQE